MKKIIFLFLSVILSYDLMAIEIPFYSHYIDPEFGSESVLRLDFDDDGSTILLYYADEDNNINIYEYKAIDAYYHDFNATIRFTIVAVSLSTNRVFGEYIDIIGRAGGLALTRGNYGTLKNITMEYKDGSSHMQGYGTDFIKNIIFSPQTVSSEKAWNHTSSALTEKAIRMGHELQQQQKKKQIYWK